MKIVKQCLVALVVGTAAHVAGSYGMELFNALQNYDLEVPFSERAAAPVVALPWLLKTTLHSASTELILFWAGYLIPAIGTAGMYVIWRSLRRKEKPRGFEVG